MANTLRPRWAIAFLSAPAVDGILAKPTGPMRWLLGRGRFIPFEVLFIGWWVALAWTWDPFWLMVLIVLGPSYPAWLP